MARPLVAACPLPIAAVLALLLTTPATAQQQPQALSVQKLTDDVY